MSGSELPRLRVADLRAAYGKIEVTHGVGFAVDRGEILAVLGPNGAGKSSLVSCIAGLVRGSGAIEFEGERIDSLSAPARALRGLALVPEHRGIFGAMNVEENLALGSRMAPRARREEAREVVLDMFPILRERLEQPAGMLSGGEQQMLAVARAMAGLPRVLILDEPTQGLAPRLFGVLIEALRAGAEDGLAIVLVEQNHSFTAKAADRCLVLAGGKVVHEGGAQALSDRQAMASRYMGTRAAPIKQEVTK
jgi:branched-chain amino acid transport system ATP-binding protein